MSIISCFSSRINLKKVTNSSGKEGTSMPTEVTVELEWESPRVSKCKRAVQEITSVVHLCAYKDFSKKDYRNPGKTGKA